MILPMTNPPTHRTAPTHEYNFSPFCLSPAEIVRSYACGRQLETLRRKEFLKLRLPPYVTPGEKENKIEKFYSGVTRSSLAGVISIFVIIIIKEK